MTLGKVKRILVALAAGEHMVPVASARAIPGRGFEGDRYAEHRGSFSGKGSKIREISIISEEAFAEDGPRSNWTPEDARRNLVVSIGIAELEKLLDKEFALGPVRLRCSGPCTPCDRPDELAGKKGFRKLFEHCGGIRAAVLTEGTISLGDSLTLVEVEATALA